MLLFSKCVNFSIDQSIRCLAQSLNDGVHFWLESRLMLLYGTHFFQYEVMSEVFTKPLQFQSNVTTLLFRKVLGLKLSQKGLVSELRREKCTRAFGVVVWWRCC